MYFFIKAKMQSFVYPCPIIQCSVSIIRKNSGHYRYQDESDYPDVAGGALTSYLRTLLVQGARSILIGAEKRTDSFSRWVCSLVERRGYWRAVVAIAAKNARLCWASLHYGDDFRLYSTS